MSHGNYYGDNNPAIITRLFGENYEGPFSDWDEWHAAELGLLAGLAAASPEFAAIATAMLGVKSVMNVVDGSLRTQLRHEPHYFGAAAAFMYLAVTFIEGGSVLQALEYVSALPF